MVDSSGPTRQAPVALAWAAVVLQIVIMILLATDEISTTIAIPLLGMVVIGGLFPAIAWMKRKR